MAKKIQLRQLDLWRAEVDLAFSSSMDYPSQGSISFPPFELKAIFIIGKKHN